MGYRYIEDLTSDVMFKVTGRTLERVFVDAAKAMMGVMYDVRKVKVKKSVRVTLQGENEKDLLYNWLSEVLTSFEIHEMFFCDFDVKITGNKLTGTLKGESAKLDMMQTLVKGVTLYKFDLKKTEDGYEATVGVDI